jgi:hypothetical protein
VATSIRVPAWRLAGAPLPSVAANVVALAAERWERPFRTRDVYDLSILTGRLDHAALETLDDALTATMLWPQLRELSGLLARSGLAAGPALPGRRRAVWGSRVRGSRVRGSRVRGSRVRGSRVRSSRVWRSRVARLRRSAALWSHPFRVAGLMAASTADSDRGALADRLAHAVQRRIGSFLLVAGSCPQAWLDEASGGG